MLLLDEPFGALDAQTRERMQAELLKMWEAERRTCVFVPHSIAEAVYLINDARYRFRPLAEVRPDWVRLQ